MADISTHSTLPTGLKAFWEMEETSGTRTDSHGTNNLTDNNTVTTGTGKMGTYSAKFTRANSESLSIADNADVNPTSDVSFSCWVKFTTTTSGQIRCFFGKDGGATTRGYAAWFINSAGTHKLVFFVSQNGSTGEELQVTLGSTLSTGIWYHVCGVWDASTSTVEFYVDGVSVGTATGTRTAIHDNAAAFYVGRFGNYSGDYTDAELDDLGLWHKTLTSSEVTDLYSSGSGLPYLQPNTTVSPNTQVVTATIPAYTVTGAATVSVATQVLTASLPQETVTANWQVNPSTQVATFSIPAYTVVAGGIAVAPAAQVLTFSLPAETILGYATVNVAAQSLTFSVPAASIKANWLVGVDPVVLTVTVPTLEFVGALWSRAARTTTGADWTRSAINNDA